MQQLRNLIDLLKEKIQTATYNVIVTIDKTISIILKSFLTILLGFIIGRKLASFPIAIIDPSAEIIVQIVLMLIISYLSFRFIKSKLLRGFLYFGTIMGISVYMSEVMTLLK